MIRKTKHRTTSILNDVPGCSFADLHMISEEQLSIKARFGTQAHKLWHMSAIKKPIPWHAIPDSPLKNYGRTFERFRMSTELLVRFAEKDLIGSRFGGRPDLIADHIGGPWLIDAKTGKLCLRYEVQLAAYGLLSREVLGIEIARYSILEVSEHSFRVRDIDRWRIAKHQQMFLAQLEVAAWAEQFT